MPRTCTSTRSSTAASVFLHSVKAARRARATACRWRSSPACRATSSTVRASTAPAREAPAGVVPASPQAELKFAPEPGATPEQRAVLDRLAAVDADELTPRAALDLLYELKRDAKR